MTSEQKLAAVKRELIALKRSLDDHVSDSERLQILKSDFEPIWQRLYEVLSPELQ